MSHRVIRVTQLPAGQFMAITHLDRIASSPELAVRMAGAAALGRELDEVSVACQNDDLYLVSARPIIASDKCHGSEVPS